MTKRFKDFNITAESAAFKGDKIKMNRLFDKEITVHAFVIKESKYKEKTDKCLYLQIEKEGVKHVVFTGSATLMDMIQKVPATEFPFNTTIVKEGDSFQFT